MPFFSEFASRRECLESQIGNQAPVAPKTKTLNCGVTQDPNPPYAVVMVVGIASAQAHLKLTSVIGIRVPSL